MNIEKILWCCSQKKGISIIDPNTHLSKAYMEEADDTLDNVSATKGKWKVITAYYACYNALYSIIMRCGIKCEIPACTIELASLFDFEPIQIKYIKELKDKRIQAQYYLKKIDLGDEEKVKDFILKCKSILNSLTAETIGEVRKKISSL